MRAFISVLFCAVVTAVSTAAWLAPAEASSLRKVALSGEQAPGYDDGVVFDAVFSPALINASGHLAFLGNLRDAASNDVISTGVFVDYGSGLQRAADLHDAFPGIPDGQSLAKLDLANFSDAGSAVYLGRLQGAGVDSTNDEAYWSDRSGSLELVFREGSTAPGASGAKFGALERPLVDRDGFLAIEATLIGPGIDSENNQGVWREITTGVIPVVREGSPIPGITESWSFTGPAGQLGVRMAGNDLYFTSPFSGAGVSESNDVGGWLIGESGTELLVRSGQTAPGTSGAVFAGRAGGANAIGSLSVTSGHDIWGIRAGIVGDEKAFGIWVFGNDQLQLVVREGEQLPGVSETALYAIGLHDAYLADNGRLYFSTSLAGESVSPGNDDVTYEYWNGTLRVVAREGMQAPGMPEGVVFGSVSMGFRRTFAIEGSTGLIAFESVLSQDGQVYEAASKALFAGTATSLRPIVKEGDLIDVESDPHIQDLRMVQSFSSFSRVAKGSDGLPRVFAGENELFLWISFADGSQGVFVIQVPEPSAWWLTVFALVANSLLQLSRGRKLVSTAHESDSAARHSQHSQHSAVGSTSWSRRDEFLPAAAGGGGRGGTRAAPGAATCGIPHLSVGL
ncbi:MAG: hypothetical protein KDA61_17070 [Planctomycetales bacterium]|nr:hypothetical protein [Planctomycetales bacterium]